MEQGSTKSKRKLEEEYRDLEPNDQGDWERQVRTFLSNSSDGDEHPVVSQNAAPGSENEVVAPSSNCGAERNPKPSQHHESMHAAVSAPSQCGLEPEANKTTACTRSHGLEGDFGTNQNPGSADASGNTGSHFADNALSPVARLLKEV